MLDIIYTIYTVMVFGFGVLFGWVCFGGKFELGTTDELFPLNIRWLWLGLRS